MCERLQGYTPTLKGVHCPECQKKKVSILLIFKVYFFLILLKLIRQLLDQEEKQTWYFLMEYVHMKDGNSGATITGTT